MADFEETPVSACRRVLSICRADIQTVLNVRVTVVLPYTVRRSFAGELSLSCARLAADG